MTHRHWGGAIAERLRTLENSPGDCFLGKQVNEVNWPEGGSSENKNFEGNPTKSKTDSSDYFGIVTPTFQYDLDHFENLTRAVSALTIDPFKNLLFYVFPFLNAYSSSYIQLRENDPAQEAMMPEKYKKTVLN